jgi:hypothetical protein
MLWAVAGVICGPYFFFRGFGLLQRKRLIMDTPRSTIRAAALGPVEVSGKAVGPYTLVAPLSQCDCLYYRMVVESNPHGDLQEKMRELCAPFFLDDGTGRLMIYPEGCELQMPASSDRSEYGKAAAAMVSRSAETPEFSQEYCIRPGDQIFVRGTLRENPWAKKNPIAESSELSRIGPGFVSADEAELLRREAFPVLEAILPARALASDGGFDLHPPVILMKGKGPFVISTDSERDLVAKLQWKSLLYIWGGPVIALWGLWKIVSYVA